MKRGQLYRIRQMRGDPKRSRVVVVVSRPVFVDAPFSSVICAPIHTGRRGIATEVAVGIDEGLKHPSSVVCDALTSVAKSVLTDYVGELSQAKLVQLRTALRVALALE